VDPIEVLSIARELLGLLYQLHSHGIAHGSFSDASVLFADKSGSPNLALIEFEFAALLATKSRSMLAQRYRAQIQVMEMSPFEIQLDRLSRRDDLFRWIELVARMLLGAQLNRVMEKESLATSLLHFKMTREYFALNGSGGWQPWRHTGSDTKRRVKSLLGNMLQYIRRLGIDEDPD